tara:strand:- start:2005 stop:2436 length:432 start_codon:yes stop_codon:yes gene_type:complete
MLAFIVYSNNDIISGIYFGIASVLSLVFYPYFIRWKYKKHFLNYIRENNSNNFGKTASLEFHNDHILTFDENESESKISLKLIKSIHELPHHHLIKLDGGQALILPKQRVNDLKQLESDLTKLANSLNLIITYNVKWQWEKSW